MQKARRHRTSLLRPLVGTRFQVLFHSPSGVLFTFPSRYLSAIGHQGVLSLGGWSPQIQTAFHGSGPTQVLRSAVQCPFTYGTIALCGARFHSTSARAWIGNCRRVGHDPGTKPYNPRQATRARLNLPGVDFSPFARRYSGSLGCFPFLEVLRCFSSPACLPPPMYSA